MGRKKFIRGDDGIYSKRDARPAKKQLKAFLRNAGINIPKHKKEMRKHGNPNANWL